MASVDRRRIVRVDGGRPEAVSDQVAVEEPLQIEVDGVIVSTTMRTPGNDAELALGWLVSEGVVTSPEQVVEARECFELADEDGDDVRRIVKVITRDQRPIEPRLHATSSACGICGADLIDFAQRAKSWSLEDDPATFSIDAILAQPARLLEAQRGFAASGGLHAAGLFSVDGDLLCVREDVGRHNAVDKVVGWALTEGRLPLRATSLQVSGRASAELVNKAIAAGIPVLAAVSAPTTLAIDLARAAGLTLAGFVRGDSVNVYACGERLGPP